MPCLVGCQEQYICGSLNTGIQDYEVLAPFVKIFFGDPNNPTITVGNESAKQWNNTACIKSFRYGHSNGMDFSVEIMDEEGGSFHLFAEKLIKCISRVTDEKKMGVEFGWIGADCDGANFTISSRYSSAPLYFIPMHLDVSFVEGRIKFTITGNDAMQIVFSARHSTIQGDDEKRQPLKMAILQLANKDDPKFDVQFKRKSKNGQLSEFSFKSDEGGINGPMGVWHSDGQNKLATIQKWIEPFRTNMNKGITALWDASSPKQQTLILLEDTAPNHDEAVDPCDVNIGTYVVNGGKCSPVVSFTPSINFVEGMSNLNTGGDVGASSTGATEVVKKEGQIQTPETGYSTRQPTQQNSNDIKGMKNAKKDDPKSQQAHTKANTLINSRTMTADLVLQGDVRPEFLHPILRRGATVSLIVLNSFHIFGDSACGDWLAQPGCNEVLSNKNWLIMGCFHEIKEGSFTTTLKLELTAPGIDTDAGSPFGGINSGGYVPNNTC
jgi:hypothetical protein